MNYSEIIKKNNPLGRPKKYTPKKLWDCFGEYIEHIDNNPMRQHDVRGKDALDVEIKKQIPYTLGSFCLFAGISLDTFINYAKNKDFLDVCTRIEQTIREQKFHGAAAGLFNHAIIARDLGLIDRSDVTSKNDKISIKINVPSEEDKKDLEND